MFGFFSAELYFGPFHHIKSISSNHKEGWERLNGALHLPAKNICAPMHTNHRSLNV